ncbi:PSME3-interacting protein [Cylas formicarius]|uniref:PSME3-interacting protein n=1 Tax=Cylas formicarius TaxID=197179 RepID=UPI002958AEB0|nr:PSME3-interacting protein [Cylas formicarius]
MSSGFITATELADIRKKRQEEWEKVRKPTDPLERPEVPQDNRSLFERLQEQKQKRDLEYEEAHKLKNMIKGLDDDEIEFLDLVDRTKIAADRKKELEEERELTDYRNRVAILQEKCIEERLQSEIAINKPKIVPNNKYSQQKLLQGIVVKKTLTMKRKISNEENDTNCSMEKQIKQQKSDEKTQNSSKETVNTSALECVAILPGLGCYGDSSSDENSSDSESSEVETTPKKDLLGRKLQAAPEKTEK